jgi:TatD DNase family protein
VGVHPHEAKEFDDEARTLLEELIGRPRVVAVGECGLDYHYMNSERDVQRAVFAEQAATARSRRMPATIHVRGDEPNAYEELLDIWLAETRGEIEGVLHCYTGILTFKNDRGLREIAKALPLERLMVETDAPLLAPQGFRGKRNEPAHVSVVGETLAALRAIPVEDVARITSENARTLFRLDDA